jgi:DNA-binding NtrC family response regulator
MVLKNANVLVVDDDQDILIAVSLLLKTEAKSVITEKNPENIRALLSRHSFDLILLDMNFKSSVHTGNEGIYWLKKLKEWGSQAQIIMVTAYGDIDLAVRALKEGANDFIVKPWHNERLLEGIKELLQGQPTVSAKLKAAGSNNSTVEIIGTSQVMQDIFYKVKKIAPTDANILILGENGTGKDLIAHAIHDQSLRSKKPFIKVDVGALTESLFESELFGHKKGAFTGANEDREGRFEAANGGTLFLDEIGNITLQQQAKLLSVLQNRQVIRLGSNIPINIDIRLICATNIPLAELADESRFRKDLIYRINTVDIVMPPLRKRDGDILLLANSFLESYSKKYLKARPILDSGAKEKLNNYPFPGNVRELQYAMERAVIMSEQDVITADDLIFSPLEKAPETKREAMVDHNLQSMEKHTILKVIDKHNGNISRAAKELGLTRTALYRRLNKYDI